MRKSGAVLVGAVVSSPVVPAQAVEIDPAVPAWKLSFVKKRAVYFSGHGCPSSPLIKRVGIAMSGKAAFDVNKQRRQGYLETSVKYPGKSWTSPARVKKRGSTEWPSKTFGSVKIKKVGKYKVKLRRVILNEDAVAPEPTTTYGPWSSVKKLKVTKSKLRKTKTIRYTIPVCK
jgi:hypothetical protein